MKRTYGDCPFCGKKIWGYNEKAYKYGSPIRTCKGCGKEYHDPCYHEMAWEGLDQKRLDAKSKINVMILLVFTACLCFMINYYDLKYRNAYYPVLYFASVVAALGAVYYLFDFLAVISGRKKAYYDRLLIESKDRISDVDYVIRLVELGYHPK